MADVVHIVLALPMKAAALDRFRELFGPQVRLRDIRTDGPAPVLVATPPLSPQAIGALRGMYPGADIMIVELDDWDLGVSTLGPVSRALSAGATAYYLADSGAQLVAGVTELLATRQLRMEAQFARQTQPRLDE